METALYRASLLLAPALYFTSGFFWLNNGLYNITGGTLVVVGSVFYVLAFNGIFTLLEKKAPRYSSFVKLLAIYGCMCGGVAFGLRDVFMDMFSVSHAVMLQALAIHPFAANIIFWVGGPTFPLSMLVLGIMLIVKKAAPARIGILLSLSAVLFPISRILRMEWLAHVTDLLMLIPLWYIAFALTAMRTTNQVGSQI